MLLFISQDVPENYDNIMKIFEELDLKSGSYEGMVWRFKSEDLMKDSHMR